MSELRTNKILPRDGLPSGSFGGGIVQVRFAALDSSTTFSANTDDFLSLNITPTSASNKILLDLRVRCQGYYSTNEDSWHFYVARTIGGGSKIFVSGKGKLGAGTVANDLGRYAFAVTTTSSGSKNPGVEAYIPALPNTTRSISEFDPNLLAPWTDTHAASPIAINPGTVFSEPFKVNTSAL